MNSQTEADSDGETKQQDENESASSDKLQKNGRLALLVRNCESIIIAEVSELVGLFEEKDK